MKSYMKLYSENKKLKKEIKALEKDKQYYRLHCNEYFTEGCANCIHGMPRATERHPIACELGQKKMCSDFVRNSSPIMIPEPKTEEQE